MARYRKAGGENFSISGDASGIEYGTKVMQEFLKETDAKAKEIKNETEKFKGDRVKSKNIWSYLKNNKVIPSDIKFEDWLSSTTKDTTKRQNIHNYLRDKKVIENTDYNTWNKSIYNDNYKPVKEEEDTEEFDSNTDSGMVQNPTVEVLGVPFDININAKTEEDVIDTDNYETEISDIVNQIETLTQQPILDKNGRVDRQATAAAVKQLTDKFPSSFNYKQPDIIVDELPDLETDLFKNINLEEVVVDDVTVGKVLLGKNRGEDIVDTRGTAIAKIKATEKRDVDIASSLTNQLNEQFKNTGYSFDVDHRKSVAGLTTTSGANMYGVGMTVTAPNGETLSIDTRNNGFNDENQKLIKDFMRDNKAKTPEEIEKERERLRQYNAGEIDLSTEELNRIATPDKSAIAMIKKYAPDIKDIPEDDMDSFREAYSIALRKANDADPRFKLITNSIKDQIFTEADEKSKELRNSYDTSTEEGLALAEADFAGWYNEEFQERLKGNKDAKRIFQEYGLAGKEFFGQYSKEYTRYNYDTWLRDNVLRGIDDSIEQSGKPQGFFSKQNEAIASLPSGFTAMTNKVEIAMQEWFEWEKRSKVYKGLEEGLKDGTFNKNMTIGEARKADKKGAVDSWLRWRIHGWDNDDNLGDLYDNRKKRWENTRDDMKEDLDEMQEAEMIQSAFNNFDSNDFSDTVANAIKQAPHMAPTMLGGLMIATGTAATVASGGAATPVTAGVIGTGKILLGVGTAVMAAQTYGDTFIEGTRRQMEEEYGEGGFTTQEYLDALAQEKYGDQFEPILTAAAVAGTEYLSGSLGSELIGQGVGSILKSGVGKKLLGKTLSNYVGNVGATFAGYYMGAAEEAVTEGFQSYLEQVGQNAMNTNGPAGDMIGKNAFTDNISMEQIQQEARMGWNMGKLFGVAGVASGTLSAGVDNSYAGQAMRIASGLDFSKGSKNFKVGQDYFKDLIKKVNEDKTLSDDQKANQIKDISAIRNASMNVPKGIDPNVRGKLINLIKERDVVDQKIKEVNDKDLTESEINRKEEISNEIKEIVANNTAEQALMRNINTVKNIIGKKSKGKTELLDFKNAKELQDYIKKSKIKGFTRKMSSNHGNILINPKTGKKLILINRDSSVRDQNVNVAGHEFLHSLLYETLQSSPETMNQLGASMDTYLSKLKGVDSTQVAMSKYQQRVQQYLKDGNEFTNEEKLTLFSDALANGDIKFEQNIFTDMMDTIRRILQNYGLEIKFNEAKDVYNFIKDYNKSIEKGELTVAQENLQTKAATGSLIESSKNEADAKDIINKSSVADVKNIDELATQYQQDPTSADIENLIQQYRNLSLKALGYDIGKGDVKAQEAVSFVDKYFNSILNRWDPAKGKLSTHITANIKPKRQEFYESEIGKKATTTSIDDERAQQVADTEQTVEFDEKEKQDTGRKKVYASQTDQVGDLDTAETKAIIKDEVSKDILLAANKGKNAADTARDIANESKKNYFKRLRKDIGTFASQKYKDFVNSLDKNFIKSLPVAIIKRRFGKLFGIKQTGTTPTKQTSKTGKPSYFNKPVYNVPKVTTQGLQDFKDYFLGGEKRQQSLYNILANDFALESIQELMADKSFMKKLDTALGEDAITAKEFMQNIENKLDSRTVENTSFDTVKASKSETVELVKETGRAKAPKSTKIRVQFSEIKNGKETKKLVERDESGEEVGYYKTITDLDAPATELSETYVTKNEQGEIVPQTIREARDMIGNTFIDKNPKLRNILKTSTTVNNKSLFGSVPMFDKSIPSRGVTQIEAQRYPYNKNKRFSQEVYDFITGDTIKFKDQQAQNKKAYIKFWMAVQDHLQQYPQDAWFFGEVISDVASAGQGSILRYAATMGFFPVDVNGNPVFNKEVVEEHSYPQVDLNESMLAAAIKGKIDLMAPVVIDAYMQGSLLKTDDTIINVDFKTIMPGNFYEITVGLIAEGKLNLVPGMASIIRMSEAGVNLNLYKSTYTGQTIAEYFGVGVDNSKLKTNKNVIALQNKAITSILTGTSKAAAVARFKVDMKLIPAKVKQNKVLTQQFSPKLADNTSTEQKMKVLGDYDITIKKASKSSVEPKGISVFDFDDTLAKTKEKVIVTKANGSVVEISAAKFAEQASELQEAGATFNFDNFENVGKGTQKGPLADLALRRQGKFGSKDIFVLTARPQIAAADIKTFLDGIGLNLPLKNITGLENGSPQAKADWVISKTAEGYNDFYFADDAIKNVKAVKEILDQVDVKSDVQLVKASKGETFDKVMNDILEDSTGIKSEAEYSKARAQTVGAKKGRFTFFTTPSAEDFVGLIYKFLGKGKVGDAQLKFFQDNLIDPYNRAEQAVTRAKISAANDFKALKKSLKTLPKSLSKQTGIGGFTFGQAARVAVWTRQGMEVPGLSKRDAKELNDFVSNNAELDVFVDELINIQKGKPYPKPGQNWLAGNITSDIVNEINKVNRKEYMQEFNENVDIIFSDKVMNKLEAAYGPRYVEALRDMFRRMKSGSNRPVGNSRIVDGLLNWLNNSVGAIMFLNTRTAVLQTISSVNFINFGNNNIIAAGRAFANQKQYWKDFMTLMNSPYLVERRDGLKINVSESEIADAVSESSNKPKAFLNLLLSKGFVLTRIADSFAIAAGGSTFYRNQIKAYMKSGMDQATAEKQAFDDFYAVAETSQQSSNPSKISQQQASGAGRVILAFANTPMQYARIIKRATQDLIAGRGDWKTNVSKIVYYGAMQNLIFNALQTALFALAFGEEDEEQEDKTGRIANGMADSLLRGLGIQGAAVVAIKDALITIYKQANKEKGSPEFRKAIADLFGFSPPLDSKVRKLNSGLNTLSWEREKMSQEGFNLNNPAYLAYAQVLAGLTNIPLDRAIQKINNLRAATSDSSAKWQKVALLMGWSTWDLGLPYYGVEDKEVQTPKTILRDKVLKMKKETSTKEQKEILLELGLTKQEIKALKYENERIKKIIELQK